MVTGCSCRTLHGHVPKERRKRMNKKLALTFSATVFFSPPLRTIEVKLLFFCVCSVNILPGHSQETDCEWLCCIRVIYWQFMFRVSPQVSPNAQGEVSTSLCTVSFYMHIFCSKRRLHLCWSISCCKAYSLFSFWNIYMKMMSVDSQWSGIIVVLLHPVKLTAGQLSTHPCSMES